MTMVDNNKMIEYIHEEQEAALNVFNNAKRNCELFAEQFAAKNYQRILLVASGTSNNSCLTAKHFFEDVTKTPVSVVTSYDYAHYNSIFRDSDLVIAVSQEGESTNTIDAIKKANENNVDNFIVTEDVNNTCTQIAKGKVVIDCGREYFGPKTKGYTCTVLTLYMMALEAANKSGKISAAEYDGYRERCCKSISNINAIIEASEEWIEKNKKELVDCEKAYVVGYGPHVGTALEGALKCLETVRSFYFSFETEEFLHGPLASVKPDVYTFIIAPEGRDYDRSSVLYNAMKEQNSHTFCIGRQSGDQSAHVLDAPFSDDEYMNVFEYIVPLQLLAYRTYSGKGIDLNTRNYPRIGDKVPTKAKALERK